VGWRAHGTQWGGGDEREASRGWCQGGRRRRTEGGCRGVGASTVHSCLCLVAGICATAGGLCEEARVGGGSWHRMGGGRRTGGAAGGGRVSPCAGGGAGDAVGDVAVRVFGGGAVSSRLQHDTVGGCSHRWVGVGRWREHGGAVEEGWLGRHTGLQCGWGWRGDLVVVSTCRRLSVKCFVVCAGPTRAL